MAQNDRHSDKTNDSPSRDSSKSREDIAGRTTRRDATRRNGSELIGSKVVYILQSVGSQGI